MWPPGSTTSLASSTSCWASWSSSSAPGTSSSTSAQPLPSGSSTSRSDSPWPRKASQSESNNPSICKGTDATARAQLLSVSRSNTGSQCSKHYPYSLTFGSGELPSASKGAGLPFQFHWTDIRDTAYSMSWSMTNKATAVDKAQSKSSARWQFHFLKLLL